jgi:hypothetical protein
MSETEGSDDEDIEAPGQQFPFPIFFMVANQTPYVLKRVCQLSRQTFLAFKDTGSPPKSP